jgi:hypothetical protein
LKNRHPAHWRDAWQLEHTLGKYVISHKPVTEQEWIEARADVIDVSPELRRTSEVVGGVVD